MAKTFLLALDAGHYKKTPGKRCLKSLDPKETREWYLNDRVSDYIAERAAMYQGFNILRVDDPTGETKIELDERCNKANKANADFYLSIHHNAGIEGGSGGGVVAYSYPGSTSGADWRNALYEAVVAAGKLKGNRATPKTTENFQVLRDSKMVACLMELGFMDSRTDVPVILSAAYAKAVGYAMADCIAARVGLTPREDVDMSKFIDVADSAWYADEVDYCVKHGLMNGMGENKFEPTRAMTRAEVAAVIARLHKELTK